jgi:gas vesicle protein
MSFPSIGDKLTVAPIERNEKADRSDTSVEQKYDSSQVKKDLNSAIIESQVKLSVSSGNKPMELLYKTALEAINKELEPTLGKGALKKSFDQLIDVTPEATAERIINGATAFLGAFKAQNKDLSDEEAMTKFMDVIGSGIDQGFDDAKDILESLSVLEGDIASNIDLTYDLVQEGLKDFVKQLAEQSQSAAEEAKNEELSE